MGKSKAKAGIATPGIASYQQVDINPALEYFQQGMNEFADTYTAHLDAAEEYGKKAVSQYAPFSAGALHTMGALNRFLGVSPSNEDFSAMLAATPGYQFQLEQGEQALRRQQAASGMLGSGNALTEALQFSQGLADQTYGDHISRLQNSLNSLMPAVSGSAQAYAGLSNLRQQGGLALGASQQQGRSDQANTLAGALQFNTAAANRAALQNAAMQTQASIATAQNRTQASRTNAQLGASALSGALGFVGGLF